MSDNSHEAAETHVEETAQDVSQDASQGVSGAAANTAVTSGHGEAELHTEVGHADTGFTCAPGLPQMCTDTFASQIFWLVLTFIFLYVMMSRVTLPKIGRVIEERRDRIADDLGKADDLRSQSETAIADYEQALADARSKAHVLAQETRDKLSAEADERKAAVEAELTTKLDAAAERIGETKAAALSSIRDVAADTAGAVVEHILGETADADAISAAVNAELQRRGN